MGWKDHPYGLMGIILGIPDPTAESGRSWSFLNLLTGTAKEVTKHPDVKAFVDPEGGWHNNWRPWPGDDRFDQYGNRIR